jgi:hypothetical protein
MATRSSFFDLRFYIASFAGYGIHADLLFTLPDFLAFVDKQLAEKLLTELKWHVGILKLLLNQSFIYFIFRNTYITGRLDRS